MKVPVHGDGMPDPTPPDHSEMVHQPISDRPAEHLDASAQTLLAGVAPLEDAHRRQAIIERVHALQSRQLRNAHQRKRELTQRAEVDALTGLRNQAAFDRDLASEVQRYPDVALVVLDLDGFKRPNDQYGHQKGNKLIQAAAEVVQSHTRPGDGAYRWGGDEFAIMFRRFADPDNPDEALEILEDRTQEVKTAMAERLQAEVQQLAAETGEPYDGDIDQLGASVAFALKQPGDTAETLFERADMNLKEVKEQTKASHQQSGFIPLLIMLALLIILAVGLALWRVVAAK